MKSLKKYLIANTIYFALFLRFAGAFVYNWSLYKYIPSSTVANLYQLVIIQDFISSSIFFKLKIDLILDPRYLVFFKRVMYAALTCVFVFYLITFDLTFDLAFVLAFSLYIFPTYLHKCVVNEIKNVKSVVLSELFAAFSVNVLFAILFYFLGRRFDSLILLRWPIIMLFISLLLEKQDAIEINNYRFSWCGIKKILIGFEYIIFLFVFRSAFFNALSLDCKNSGEIIKLFLLGYGFVSAFLSLYIRKIFAEDFSTKGNRFLIINRNIVVILFFLGIGAFVLFNSELADSIVSIFFFLILSTSSTLVLTLDFRDRLFFFVLPSLLICFLGYIWANHYIFYFSGMLYLLALVRLAAVHNSNNEPGIESGDQRTCLRGLS